jgi:hypothetical protein
VVSIFLDPQVHLIPWGTQHTLATASEASGQVKEAVQLLEHVAKIRERTLAEAQPDRLASQHALAIAYGAMVWRGNRRR